MDVTQLTPERQKMLIGVVIAGFLMLLALSLAPPLEVADAAPGPEADELLVLADDETDVLPVRTESPPRAFRRERMVPLNDVSVTEAEEPAGRLRATLDPGEDERPKALHSVPPAYQHRLDLLAEEEAALLRNRQRGNGRGANIFEESVPMVTTASEEAPGDGLDEVEQALAESRRPRRLRRVQLIEGEEADQVIGRTSEPRGAWLSGRIEIE